MYLCVYANAAGIVHVTVAIGIGEDDNDIIYGGSGKALEV